MRAAHRGRRVLKLETQGAIRNLPDILFAALRYRPTGLMIARGDLAVEASFEQLAQLQEDILGFGAAPNNGKARRFKEFVSIRLDPLNFGTHSLRRTKATLKLKQPARPLFLRKRAIIAPEPRVRRYSV